MNNGGYIKLFRRFRNDWKFSRPEWRSAWVWLLIYARWTPSEDGLLPGQVRFSLAWAQEHWGMSKSAASRFLKRCEADGDILWERRSGGYRVGPICDQFATTVGTITLVKWEAYQVSEIEGGTNLRPICDHSLSNLCTLKKEKKEQEPQPSVAEVAPSSTTKPKKPRNLASHDPVVVEKALVAINLSVFHAKYPEMDVDRIYEDFHRVCMYGTPKKPGCNPYNYKGWEQAFENWIIKKKTDGQFLRPTPPPRMKREW